MTLVGHAWSYVHIPGGRRAFLPREALCTHAPVHRAKGLGAMGHAALWRPPLPSTLGESSRLGSHFRNPLSHPPCRTTANELVPDKSGTTTQPTFPWPQVRREGKVQGL